jgi:NOL1/NOP2/fmu family ribosome biogenesis protein
MRPDAMIILLTDEEAQTFITHLSDRFGFPLEVFGGLAFYRRGKRYLYVTSTDVEVFPQMTVESVGLPLLRMQHEAQKLSTRGACLLGRCARHNVVDLDADQMDDYLHRRDIRPRVDQLSKCTSGGQVIVCWNGHPAGIGWLKLHTAPPVLMSMYPRSEAAGEGQHAFRAPPRTIPI